jgi:exodeoxyribonuclease-3
MNIFSWNVNGIRALQKKGTFQEFIDRHKPDIICLQEIKAFKNQINFNLDNYFEYIYPAQKPGYSGTAILSTLKPLKEIYGLPEEIIKEYDLQNDPYGNPNDEGRVLALEYQNFYVVSVYTPNAKDDLSRLPLRHNQWDPAFLKYMLNLKQKKEVIFCGDLNVAHTEDDLANPKPNEGKKGFTKEEREGIDKIIQNGFIDSFREYHHGNGHYTWWSYFARARERNIGWRIDYIFISQKLRPKLDNASIYPKIMGSDHCPIAIKLNI